MELIVGLGVIIGIGVVTFSLIYFVLAPRNLFFTFVKEGTAKIIVRGDKFERALIQWEGRTFQYSASGEEKWAVVSGVESHLFGGLRYYGLWPIFDVYIYDFQWTGVTEKGDVVHHPRETLDFILLREDIYWGEVEDAEDKKLLPLGLELILTVAVINPYKALFNIQNWLETVINRIKPLVRDLITQDEFENLIQRKEALGNDLYGKAAALLEEFRNRYGVDVRKIQVKEVNPPDGYREATLKQYLAEQEKKKVEVDAAAEAFRLETIAEGEAARIKRVYGRIQKFGDLGKLVRALEATEKSPLAASLTVQAVPGIQEVLRGVFGKSPEETTQKEIKELKEMVEKMLKRRNP